MMAFQAGGPHAQDRGFEAVTYAWQEMSRIPGVAIWEKPQGKNDPIRMEKQFTVVPRGVALPGHRQHRHREAAPGRDPAAGHHRQGGARSAAGSGLRSRRRAAGRARSRR
ncbi:hypothetical protein G6F22_020548 [Rhizopus arrhizus]|nr:hypothetical protein G6F22_020548 [Rhizopus arrhizus]